MWIDKIESYRDGGSTGFFLVADKRGKEVWADTRFVGIKPHTERKIRWGYKGAELSKPELLEFRTSLIQYLEQNLRRANETLGILNTLLNIPDDVQC